jgi:hypothetical protein
MPNNQNEELLKKGYCEVLNALGYGAAKPDGDFWGLNIVEKIPEASTPEFDKKFLLAVGNICKIHGWSFSTYPPSISDSWNFLNLFNNWFLKRVIINPGV